MKTDYVYPEHWEEHACDEVLALIDDLHPLLRIKAVVRLDESGIVLSKLRNGRVLISEKMSATPTVYCTYSVYHKA